MSTLTQTIDELINYVTNYNNKNKDLNMGNCQQQSIITEEKKDDNISSTKPQVFFVLGGPGAGKGTQCANLVNEFGLIHLSAGDLLRAERNSGSSDAELINNCIKDGKIVPVAITVGLIKRAMLNNMRVSNKYIFVIDGFPRNHDNLQGWNRICGGSFANVPFLLHLRCSEEEMTKRILSRAEKSTVKS
eukprot:98786_1